MTDTLSCEGCADLSEIDYCVRFHKHVFRGNLRPHQCMVAEINALKAELEKARDFMGRIRHKATKYLHDEKAHYCGYRTLLEGIEQQAKGALAGEGK